MSVNPPVDPDNLISPDCQPVSEQDRERLSAWLDGELRGEQSRFVAKRVAHDVAMQAQAQRWSLCGELLRESANRDRSMQVPQGFVDRVRVAIDQERAGVAVADAADVGIPAALALSNGSHFNFRGWLQKPTAIAASLSLVATAVLLMNFNLPSNNGVTASLAMQQITLPEVKANNATVKRNNRTRDLRIAQASRQRVVPVTRTVVATSSRIAAPAAVATTPASSRDALVKRVTASPAVLNAAVRPNVVASNSDPFGIGPTTDSRIMSGKPWPRQTITGSQSQNVNMRASFNNATESGATAWPSAVRLGISAPGGN